MGLWRELGIRPLVACFGPTTVARLTAPGAIGFGRDGDLLTFHADWRDAVDTYPSGYALATERLATPGGTTSFGPTDLLEDGDGYLIARAVLGGAGVGTAVRGHYVGGGGPHRFSQHHARFLRQATLRAAG